MKTFFQVIVSVLVLFFIASCGQDNITLPQNATSQICPNVVGAEAVWWDITNGIPRGDLPGGTPVINNPGGTYFHPEFPALGFVYPAGYIPTTLSDQFGTTVGVNLIRQDNQVLYRWISTQTNGIIGVNDALNFEVAQFLNFIGNPANVTTVCANSGTTNNGVIRTDGSSVMLRAGNFTAVINMNTTYVDGLNTTFIAAQVTMGPTQEYPNLIVNTFLPISWQMLYSPEDAPVNTDTDGDGVLDQFDDFPFDPTRF
ncbi:MAG: hypothetical protein AAF502_23570 [Bacteroidota bacterium]